MTTPKTVVAVAWHSPPPAVDPICYLQDWQVMEKPDGARHFIGRNRVLDTGRTSTAIVSFDPATGQGVTESGRIYELIGGSGVCEKATLLWQVKCDQAGITSVDVSTEYQAITRRD